MAPPEPPRPDPDALLAATRREGRGRLKIFLGMAPGVGKTYEMLSTAARRADEGLDVAVGLVETHGRRDTEALVGPLDVLPRKPIEHRGHVLMEFDIDAALARRPEAPAGGRIRPLQRARFAPPQAMAGRGGNPGQPGIDVWTTLNVQHLESLMEVVWRITGVRQQETVPDEAFARADAIEVVDITPEELRERLASGKVYVPETARLASDRFFKVENLTALRELALRRAAQTVDDALIGHMRGTGIEGPWAAGRADPGANRRRSFGHLAGTGGAAAGRHDGRPLDGHARGTAEPSHRSLARPWTRRRRVQAGGAARRLGGQSVSADDSAGRGGAVRAAQQHHPARDRPRRQVDRWRALFGRSLAHVLLERASGVALHVVTDVAPGEHGCASASAFDASHVAHGLWRSRLAGAVVAANLHRHRHRPGGVRRQPRHGLPAGGAAHRSVGSGFGPAIVAAATGGGQLQLLLSGAASQSFTIGHPADYPDIRGLLRGGGDRRVPGRAAARSGARHLAPGGGHGLAPHRQPHSVRRRHQATRRRDALAEQAAASVRRALRSCSCPSGGEIKPAAGAPELKHACPPAPWPQHAGRGKSGESGGRRHRHHAAGGLDLLAASGP